MQRVTVGLEDGVAAALASRACVERRSVASMARVLIEAGLNGVRVLPHVPVEEVERVKAGLGGEEPRVAAAILPGDDQAAALTSPEVALSSPPSPAQIAERVPSLPVPRRPPASANTGSAAAPPCGFDTPRGVKCKSCGKTH